MKILPVKFLGIILILGMVMSIAPIASAQEASVIAEQRGNPRTWDVIYRKKKIEMSFFLHKGCYATECERQSFIE